MAGEKVVVTGGAGFIGSHLVRGLLGAGYEVTIVDTLVVGKKENVPPEAVLHELDICDTEKIKEVFSGARFVFHLAATPQVQYSIEHPQETHDTNVTGTLSILLAARDAKVTRVVLASSAAVYGDQDAPTLQEHMPASPKSPYGLHKYIDECYARLFSEVYQLPTVSLRYFNVFGPGAPVRGAYSLVTAIFIDKRKNNEPLPVVGDGEQTRDFIHVRDIARANMLAATSEKVGKGEAINIGSGQPTSVNTIAALVGGPTTPAPARLEPGRSCADITRAKNLLGWEPQVRLADGIAELKKLAGIV